MAREYIMNLILNTQDQQISSSDGELGTEINEIYDAMTFIRSNRNQLAIQISIVSSTQGLEPDGTFPNNVTTQEQPVQDDLIDSSIIIE